jgi:hypothetical protein
VYVNRTGAQFKWVNQGLASVRSPDREMEAMTARSRLS